MQIADAKVYKGTMIGELDEHLKSRKIVEQVSPVNELVPYPDATFALEGQGGLRLNPVSVGQLANLIGIGKAYLKRAPNDIAFENLTYWLPRITKNMRFTMEGEVITSMMDPAHKQLRNEQVLEVAVDECSNDFELHRWVVDIRGMSLSWSTDLEISAPDSLKGGVRVNNWETLERSLVLQGITYRLICTNDAVIHGDGWWNTRQYWREPLAILRDFGERFRNVISNLNVLQEVTWDQPVTLSPEQAGKMLKEIGHISYKYHEPFLQELETVETFYDLYNLLTVIGRDCVDRKIRDRWEELAGTIALNPSYIESGE